LLTVAVPGARTLTERLADGLPAAAWSAVGATIRRFHDAGFCHADLNAHNILLDDTFRVTLIDFDRGTRRAAGRWRAANLARLQRSLRKVSAAEPEAFSADHWAALLAGYGDQPR
jgi:3-deoxy-D-manno-octulosonic acid kinase